MRTRDIFLNLVKNKKIEISSEGYDNVIIFVSDLEKN